MDGGYEVLISTGFNDPDDEEYTSVFKAAEMTHSFDVDYLSLDLDDYLFQMDTYMLIPTPIPTILTWTPAIQTTVSW
ncbi:MAG: hypothetical protein R2792_03425 [Saprospiraceae bacterium]